jgi:hypothetical protein
MKVSGLSSQMSAAATRATAPETGVVARCFVFFARVTEADDQLHRYRSVQF